MYIKAPIPSGDAPFTFTCLDSDLLRYKMASGRKFHHFIIDFWAPEGAAFIASSLCFAALVALLAFYDGKEIFS